MSNTQWEGTGVQNLIRHRQSGNYYGRFSVQGKRKYVNLQTKRKPEARVRLLEEAARIEKTRVLVGGAFTMADLFKLYRRRVEADPSLSPATRLAREDHLKRIEKTWPELAAMAPTEVTISMICEWNVRARTASYTVFNGVRPKRYAPASVTKSVETLQRVFRIAVEKQAVLSNPFDAEHSEKDKLRAAPRSKKLWLPESAVMERVFSAVERPPLRNPALVGINRRLEQDAAWVGELVRFLAYTGARLAEAGAATWDDIKPQGVLIRGTKSEDSQDRLVPWHPALRGLIEEIRKRRKLRHGPLLLAHEAQKSLDRACREVGVPRITHHTLRHYFATVAIESGVDIPVLAGWLGHADGGVLAMRTYGHLRTAHSVASASRLDFGRPAPPTPECKAPSLYPAPAPGALPVPSAIPSPVTAPQEYSVL